MAAPEVDIDLKVRLARRLADGPATLADLEDALTVDRATLDSAVADLESDFDAWRDGETVHPIDAGDLRRTANDFAMPDPGGRLARLPLMRGALRSRRGREVIRFGRFLVSSERGLLLTAGMILALLLSDGTRSPRAWSRRFAWVQLAAISSTVTAEINESARGAARHGRSLRVATLEMAAAAERRAELARERDDALAEMTDRLIRLTKWLVLLAVLTLAGTIALGLVG